eukprot:g10570.t1
MATIASIEDATNRRARSDRGITTPEPKFHALLDWVRQNSSKKLKAAWNKVQLGRELLSDGDGVMVAMSAIPRGVKLTLPPACIITQDKVADSVVGKLFGGLDVYTLFSLFLLNQKQQGQSSFWEPYINVLPSDISFHPITFLAHCGNRTEEQNKTLKAELENYPLLKRALVAQKAKLEGEWKRVKQLIKLHRRQSGLDSASLSVSNAIGQIGYNEFLWANCMVISRAFNIAEPRMMCMLPLVDSMNHNSLEPNVKWKPKFVRGHFIMHITSDIDASVELTAAYHEHPTKSNDARAESMANLKCYLMYGFVEYGLDDGTPFVSVRRAVTSRP